MHLYSIFYLRLFLSILFSFYVVLKRQTEMVIFVQLYQTHQSDLIKYVDTPKRGHPQDTSLAHINQKWFKYPPTKCNVSTIKTNTNPH